MNLMQRLLADFSRTQNLTQKAHILRADADAICKDPSAQSIGMKGRAPEPHSRVSPSACPPLSLSLK